MDKHIRKFKYLTYGAIILSALLTVIALFLGVGKDSRFFWGILTVLPFAAAAVYLHLRLAKLKRIKAVRELWGKPFKHKRDFQEIPHLFRSIHAPGKSMVDDSTWQDLNLDAVFSMLDRTYTTQGESVLYALLRTPCTPESAGELQDRHKMMTRLQTDQRTRENLQVILHKLGKSEKNNLTHLLWDSLPPKNPLAFVYSLLALAALVALTLPFLLGAQGLFLLMLMFSLNSFIHYRVSNSYAHRIPAIIRLAAMLRTARSLAQADLPGLEKEQQILAQGAAATRKILRKTRYLFTDSSAASDMLFVLQHIQILFLTAIRSFYGTLEEVKRQSQMLRDIYQTIGTLDALQAAASYRESVDWNEPVLTSANCLKAEEIRHPLLTNPTANSIHIQDQGVLITGSNMAGKSTFLRTLGVNAILAQSLYICLAKSYTASFLQVATSIDKADDISHHKSLYYAEAERLLNIIRPSYGQLPGLILIDELLSGTNYTERLAASEAILNYLKTKNALVVVATHDLDLAEKLLGTYQCYHFSDKMDNNSLGFDYTLKKGIAKTRNAIKLLAYLGYPEEIIQHANRQ